MKRNETRRCVVSEFMQCEAITFEFSQSLSVRWLGRSLTRSFETLCPHVYSFNLLVFCSIYLPQFSTKFRCYTHSLILLRIVVVVIVFVFEVMPVGIVLHTHVSIPRSAFKKTTLFEKQQLSRKARRRKKITRDSYTKFYTIRAQPK